MNILVTGKNGQLGSEFQSIQENYKHTFLFTGSSELDITNFNELESYIQRNNIDVLINCAAYTAVDKAEDDSTHADKVNHIAVQHIDALSLKYNFSYIHFSTDYVFNGKNTTPYQVTEPTRPIGVYGQTKHEGEQIILNSESNSLIIRTSWVFSSFGNNFVKTMLRLGKDRKELNVVSDQVGQPTYAHDLALDTMSIIDSGIEIGAKGKLYHYSNKGAISWFQFAEKIMELGHTNCTVHPISTEDYPTRAERPKYSVLDTSKIEKDYDLTIANWENALARCLKKLQ